MESELVSEQEKERSVQEEERSSRSVLSVVVLSRRFPARGGNEQKFLSRDS